MHTDLYAADREHAGRGQSWTLSLQSLRWPPRACACLQRLVPQQLTGSTNPASSSQHLEVEHHDNRDLPKMAARLTCSPAQRAPAGNSKKEDKNAASIFYLSVTPRSAGLMCSQHVARVLCGPGPPAVGAAGIRHAGGMAAGWRLAAGRGAGGSHGTVCTQRNHENNTRILYRTFFRPGTFSKRICR